MNYTHEQIAADFDLWTMYVDPDETMTREDFEELPMSERLVIISDCFGEAS